MLPYRISQVAAHMETFIHGQYDMNDKLIHKYRNLQVHVVELITVNSMSYYLLSYVHDTTRIVIMIVQHIF